MRVLRSLMRLSILMLVGFAVFFGLILLFKAQVALDQRAERYMKAAEAPSAPTPAGMGVAASNGPALASVATSEPIPANSASPSNSPVMPNAVSTRREPTLAIHVSNAESVASLAAPDRWVDIVLTHQSETGSTFSEVVLENVRVLAMEAVAVDGDSGERSAIQAVTLDVDVDTAQDLSLASRSGRLSLVLHEPADRRRPVDARQTSSPEVADKPPPSAPDDAHFTEVTVNRVGGKPSTHRVPREP